MNQLDLPEVDIEKGIAALQAEQDHADDKKQEEVVSDEGREEKEGKEEKTEVEIPVFTDKTEEKQEEKRKVVPLSALQEARKESKELKERMKRKEAEDQQRFNDLQAKLDKMQNPPAEKPTFDDDPFNYLKNEVEEVKRLTAQTTEQNQRQKVENIIANHLTEAEANFTKEHPDYSEASGHVIKTMQRNMELLGVPVNAENLRQEILRLTVNAARAGKNPAETIYEMSKNLGYITKDPKAQENKEKLETIAKGQQASTTLGSGSKGDSGTLTLDSLSKMDDDDFNALVLDPKKWAQVGKLMH